MRSLFSCPVCGGELEKLEKSFLCKSGHSFDISRQGYVNLLMNQQSSQKHHGDDKLMVSSRKSFLEKGYYSFFKDGICAEAVSLCPGDAVLLDAGCGEGYYTSGVYEALSAAGKNAGICGIDISKAAAAAAARQCPFAQIAVAGVFHIPCADNGTDIVLNIFSPNAAAEYCRVLRPGGWLIRAVPLTDHLMGLKRAIYDTARENIPEPEELPGFDLVKKVELKKELVLDSGEDIMNLFRMTPYYYKTGERDQKKAEELSSLKTELSFGLLIYQKNRLEKR